MITLRDYQIAAIESIYDYFKKNSGNPLIAIPTAGGKSLIIAGFLESIFKQYSNQKILIVTHVKELIQQNYEKLKAIWPNAPAGVYSAGLNSRDTLHNIIFAGIASVVKKAKMFGKIDLIIIDEAQLVSSKNKTNYKLFIDDLKKTNPNLKIIGLTATPWRLDQGHLTDGNGIFTDVCFDMTKMDSFNWLISEGYLSELIPKRTKFELDVTGVKIQAGDYNLEELQIAVDKTEITIRALRETMEIAYDRNCWLIFASGIDHAIHCAEILTSLGVECRAVHSGLKKEERDGIIKDWKSGKLKAVSNNNVLTVGIDNPSLDLIVFLRPTQSPILWVQALGRGTRTNYAKGYDISTKEGRLEAIENSNKKDCLVLDFSGNTKRLGPINDPVLPCKKGAGGSGKAPIKVCPVCDTYNHTTVRICAGCGHEFKFQIKIKQESAELELVKQDIPIVKVYKVDKITYACHKKLGRPDSLKITYYCGISNFVEYIPVEASGSVRGIAIRWWKIRQKNSKLFDLPDTVEHLLNIVNLIPVVTDIRIHVNKKYPEILAYCFDGTSFNQEKKNVCTI